MNLNLRERYECYLEDLEEQQKYQAVENTIRHSTDGQKERWHSFGLMQRHGRNVARSG